jgi:hypothetical protein
MSEDPLALSKISAAPPAETDYEAICAAVMETERGRWFLTEYARRNRHADTNVILSAIERIEAAIRGEEVSPDSNHLRLDLLDMAEVIARTEAELAAIKPEPGPRGNPDDAERRKVSTSAEVLAAAERVLDIVWSLRERDVDAELCDALHAAASELHAASEHQNFTALRADKAMQVLRHLESRIIALIDVWGGRPSPVNATANGAATAEHEVADIDVATAVRPDVAAPEPEARHDEEPEVREPLDLDPLMPAEVPREARTEAEAQTDAQTHANVEVETAAPQPIEEANLIDEAAAMIAAASEAAAASETEAEREAEPEPAPEAPAEPETLASDPDTHPEPPAVPAANAPIAAANAPFVYAAARRHVFVVYQASETVVDEAPLDAPDAPPPAETDIDAGAAPAMLEPQPAVATVDELATADAANIAAAPSIESQVAPPAEIAESSEPEQPPSQPDEAADEAAADAVVAAVAEAMAETAVETEPASTVADVEADHGATAHEKTDAAAPVVSDIEPASAPEPGAQVLIEPEAPHRPDDHELDMSVAPTAAEEHSVTAEALVEDEAQTVELPVHDHEPPIVEIATENEIEIAASEIGVAAGLDVPAAQMTENSDAPPAGDPTAPNAVDDIEFLLEPMPSPDAPAPDAAMPADEVTALATDAGMATPEPAAPLLLPEPDEDPADLFEMLPDPQPSAAEIPAPSLDVAPAESEVNDASLDAAIAASAAAIPEPTFADPPPALAAAPAETPPGSAAVAAPPSRIATRPILTPRVTPNDPMAAVRALSEDELIALFS